MAKFGQGGGPPRVGLQLTREETITLHKAGNTAVANDVAGHEFMRRGRIVEVETYLASTGAASGATQVDGKLNGTSIFTAVPSIAFNAATKRRRDAAGAPIGATGGSGAGVLTPCAGEPAGVRVQPGDYYRVDVLAVAGTVGTDLTVVLRVVFEDV